MNQFTVQAQHALQYAIEAAEELGHNYIGTDDALGGDIVFRSEGVAAAVNVGGEPAAFGSELSDGGEGKDLESAAVRKDGTVPVLELVKSSSLPEDFKTRPQIQMVSISKDNLCADIFLEVTVIHTLDRTYRAYRHENGGMNLSMVGGDDTCTGMRGSIVGYPGKIKHPLFLFQKAKLRKILYICESGQ
jgi:hypothetical protein